MVLYSGYAVAAAILGGRYLLNLRQGYNWLKALPSAYMTSLIGAIIFATAGNLDFIWHAVFGFEENVEALVSPSHLSVEDLQGTLDAILFPEIYRQAKAAISSTKPFLLTGVIEMDTERGEPFLKVEKAAPIK